MTLLGLARRLSDKKHLRCVPDNLNLPVGSMLLSRKEVERCHLHLQCLVGWERGVITGVGTSLGHFDDEVHHGRTREAPRKGQQNTSPACRLPPREHILRNGPGVSGSLHDFHLNLLCREPQKTKASQCQSSTSSRNCGRQWRHTVVTG